MQSIELYVRGRLDSEQEDEAIDIVRSAAIDALGELREAALPVEVRLVDTHGNTETWDLGA